LAGPVQADIYFHVDDKGVLNFTNVPTSSDYQVYVKEKKAQRPRHRYTSRYDHYIKEASRRFGLDFPLVKAVIKAESNFEPLAISRAGAIGLMQIMPKNFKNLQIKDPYDPWQNIKGGTRYLKQMIERFGGELPLALAAYNAGPHVVERYNSIPPYKETKEYVKRVMRHYRSLKKREN
jgi:soluble lytic murein transglycosylase